MPLYKDLRLVARFQADPIYFITTKGNKAVLQRLNDALMNIHANTPEFENTTYAAYYEQSSLLTQPLLTKKERDFLAHRGPITIGFLPNDEPLSAFSSETNPAGRYPARNSQRAGTLIRCPGHFKAAAGRCPPGPEPAERRF